MGTLLSDDLTQRLQRVAEQWLIDAWQNYVGTQGLTAHNALETIANQYPEGSRLAEIIWQAAEKAGGLRYDNL